MKRLLTTAMVLVMLLTMFCASPTVTAAGTPEMVIKVICKESTADTISATLTNTSDAKWVVWSVRSTEENEYIFIDEKRGNKAQEFSFEVDPDEKAALQATENFTIEAKISYADGTVKTLNKNFRYNDFEDTQAIILDMLNGDKSIIEATDELVNPRPSFYSSNDTVDAAIIESLNEIFAEEIEGSLAIDPEEFYSELISTMLIESINSNNPTVIKNILDNFYGDVGINVDDIERTWYEDQTSDDTKTNVASRLAGFTYEEVSDFTNQFKAIAFLDKLSLEPVSTVMKFLEENNGNYIMYNMPEDSNMLKAENIVGPLTLVFGEGGYDTAELSASVEEESADFMAGSYASLADLDARFAALLLKLSDTDDPENPDDDPFEEPQKPSQTPPVSTGPSTGPTVSVGVTAPVVNQPVNPFTDIDDVSWAKEAIIALAEEGVIEGVSAKQYQPNANVTREQFVKIIVNTFGLKGTGAEASFGDIDQNAWYASYINTAVELGIIKGVNDSAFGVGQNISRQDMTLIMYRVAKIVGINISATSGRTFSDAESIDDYAIEGVTALYQAGIVNGVGEGVFGGQQTATRAQAAKLCYDLRKSK